MTDDGKITIAWQKGTLKRMIEALPSPDVSNRTVKELALQLILDTDDDLPESQVTPRGNLKLAALKLLAHINSQEEQGGRDAEVLELLKQRHISEVGGVAPAPLPPLRTAKRPDLLDLE